MINNKNISIIGCGWLGLPLANKLIQLNYKVKGTTTNKAKLNILAQNDIQPFLFDFQNNDHLPEPFFDTDTLIIATPHKTVSDYKQLIADIIKYNVKRVVFISSTSVYENSDHDITEDSSLKTDSALVKIEKLFQAAHFQTTILRFSGLFGPGRHPGRFFKHEKPIPNPDRPINFIHLEDCIQIIERIIKKDSFPNTFNGTAPEHPTRRDFYKTAFRAVGRSEPSFENGNLSSGKLISGSRLESELDYQFIHPNPIKSLVSIPIS